MKKLVRYSKKAFYLLIMLTAIGTIVLTLVITGELKCPKQCATTK